MLSLRNRVGGIGILLIFVFNASGQFSQYERPQESIFKKGLLALHQGDTLEAFQLIQSAYHFAPVQEDIRYHFVSLSLILQKPAAEKLAITYLSSTTNKIYSSRINYYLGEYYVKIQNTAEALQAFTQVQIEDINNDELMTMKYLQGYIYFKEGNWESHGLIK